MYKCLKSLYKLRSTTVVADYMGHNYHLKPSEIKIIFIKILKN